jgi:thiamine pyrophosphokinase
MSTVFAKSIGITVVGGGALSPGTLAFALRHAPALVAADGGADRALALGHVPDLVVGDLDSLSDEARAQLADRLHLVTEQDTTDFDKVLTAIEAPFVLAVGFSGARLDHTLAAMSTVAQARGHRVILLTDEDILLLCPPRLALDLPESARVSLYPLAPVRCTSRGLRWTTDSLLLDPLGRIGTSNAATGGPVVLQPAAPALLVLFERTALDAVISAVGDAPLWPGDAHAQ